jgi:transcriptional regulator with GAF, ATPase, and Fis domain
MILKKLLGQSAKSPEEEKPPSDLERFERALFEIGSVIRSPKNLPTILAFITRESLKFVGATRSAIFLVEGKGGTLKIQYTYALDPANKQVTQFEEKGVAWAISQRKPILLQGPKDFSDFFNHEQQEQKITSLLCIPLSFQGKSVGALSLVLTDEKRSFSEKDPKYLAVLGNQAAFAIENAHLREELAKEIGCRMVVEKYLDEMLQRIQGGNGKESGCTEERIGSITREQIGGGDPAVSNTQSGKELQE